MTKIKIAFICTHNSCRSQMAEAIARHILPTALFEIYSAGTHPKVEINSDAVDTIKELYGIDMTTSQKPKLLDEIPQIDIAITMGCGVNCPLLPCKMRFDWGLTDPTGKSRDDFISTAKIIEQKIRDLQNIVA